MVLILFSVNFADFVVCCLIFGFSPRSAILCIFGEGGHDKHTR